jgi:hypothetical protein
MTTSTDRYYWSLEEVATAIGVTYNSARTYHGRAEMNRKHGAKPRPSCKMCQAGLHSEKPGDLPPPDRYFGKSPAWKPDTIQQWIETRPGRGIGGGRRPGQTKRAE